MVKEIFSYDVVADIRYKTPHYTIYLVGQWDYHLMNWRGCNYRRIKAPNQPKFTKIMDAVSWVEALFDEHKKKREEWKKKHPKSYGYLGFSVEGEGQHVADSDNIWEAKLVCDDGTLTHKWRHETLELDQEQWKELREDVREARKSPERWTT